MSLLLLHNFPASYPLFSLSSPPILPATPFSSFSSVFLILPFSCPLSTLLFVAISLFSLGSSSILPSTYISSSFFSLSLFLLFSLFLSCSSLLFHFLFVFVFLLLSPPPFPVIFLSSLRSFPILPSPLLSSFSSLLLLPFLSKSFICSHPFPLRFPFLLFSPILFLSLLRLSHASFRSLPYPLRFYPLTALSSSPPTLALFVFHPFVLSYILSLACSSLLLYYSSLYCVLFFSYFFAVSPFLFLSDLTVSPSPTFLHRLLSSSHFSSFLFRLPSFLVFSFLYLLIFHFSFL